MSKIRPKNRKSVQPGKREHKSKKKQDWERLYRAAILESDSRKLVERVEQAQSAILARAQALAELSPGHEAEHEALSRALHVLGLLGDIGPKP
jgi:hypothetical protein